MPIVIIVFIDLILQKKERAEAHFFLLGFSDFSETIKRASPSCRGSDGRASSEFSSEQTPRD